MKISLNGYVDSIKGNEYKEKDMFIWNLFLKTPISRMISYFQDYTHTHTHTHTHAHAHDRLDIVLLFPSIFGLVGKKELIICIY